LLKTLTLDDSSGTPVTIHSDALTSKRALTKATGLVGIGSVRNSGKRPRPTAHGGINQSHWEDGGTITLEGQIGSQTGIEDALSEFRTIAAPMLQTLDVGAALLKWQEGSVGVGNALQMLVRLDSDVEPVIQEAAAIVEYQAQFFAEDPRAYSQTLTTVSSSALSTLSGGMVMPFTFPFAFAASGGGVCACTNAGNRPTPPVFRIFGGVTNPTILLVGGTRIVLNGTVAAGDYLELDAWARTVKLVTAGSTAGVLRQNFYDAANSQWFDLPAGSSSVQLIAGVFDGTARLDVLFRSAYA
jgi:hypothetical protein